MAAKAIIPTLGGEREPMLADTVELFHRNGFETIVIRNNTTGGGHYEGLKLCDPDDVILLAGDDVQCKDLSSLGIAIDRAKHGWIVAPRIYQANGGKRHTHLKDGQIVWLSEFPFALGRTFWNAWPWPQMNHFCDSWISHWANQCGCGPMLTDGFEFYHLVETAVSDEERIEYPRWLMNREMGRT